MKRQPNIARRLLRARPRRTPAYAYASPPASHAHVACLARGPEDRRIKTASHELGHGRFQLRHTFVPPLEIADTTDNLMSYHPTGTTLCKRQWDYLHDPQWRVFRFLQGEEEGRIDISALYNTITLLSLYYYELKGGVNGEIEIARFIEIVKEIESAYASESKDIILTKIRRLYYPGPFSLSKEHLKRRASFDQLLPSAPNYIQKSYSELAKAFTIRPIGLIPNESAIDVVLMFMLPYSVLPEENSLSNDRIPADSYEIITTPGYENANPYREDADNPSPYVILTNGEKVDIGHALLTLDALLHPETGTPFSDWGVPNIVPASWVADLALAVQWAYHYAKEGKVHQSAPQSDAALDKMRNSYANLILHGNLPASDKAFFDCFYDLSAPEADLLGDIDGYGLYTVFTQYSKLSLILEGYYGNAEKEGLFNHRYLLFCKTNQLTNAEFKLQMQLYC